jgi:DNA-binding NarL/FixJ family response regulator
VLLDHLTNREQEVLILIADGKRNKEIARELGISVKTVACHRYRLLSKFGARNAVHLTRAAIRLRLIEP